MPSPRPAVLALSFAITGAAAAQQFVDRTSTLFPQPNATDYTNYVDVGDIDGDGDLDLVFANGGNFSSAGANQVVRVYVNYPEFGDRFLDETATRTAGITGLFRGVALGDVDGDGDLDMLLAQDFNRQSKLLINNGAGVFADETATRLPAITLSATRGQFGDIDNDGDLDIYINNGGTTNRFGCGQNRLWFNDGTGVFTDDTVGRHPLGNVCQPMDAIFGDVDNDFDLDVRTGNRGSGNSRMYLNDGTGSFSDASGGVPSDSSTYSYDFGDMNGDGILDLLGANSGPSNNELLLQGVGTGAFTNVSSQLTPNTSGDDNDSKFFDLDMDGDLDLIVAALGQGTEKLFVNNGSGVFTGNNALITSVSDSSLDVAVADFNGDGRPDIVTAQGESGSFANRIYINTTGPVDTIDPDVARTEQVPDTCDAAGPYVVRAAIFDQLTSDRGFYDDGVTLHYSVDGGADQTVEMMWAGNSLWRGEIPGQSPGSSVAYFVEASDRSGNVGTGATLTFDIGGAVGDLNGDGNIGFADLNLVLAAWGPCPGCPEDLDGDGSVGFTDLNLLLANWGPAAGCGK